MKYLLAVFIFAIGILVGVVLTPKLLTWHATSKSKPGLTIDKKDFPQWRIPVEVKFSGNMETGVACSQIEPLCLKVEATAKRLGGLGGINAVGSCKLHHYLDWAETMPQ